MEEFNIGDVVVLKSGGEKMTIKSIGFPHDDQIQCQWFENQKLKLENFYPKMLIKV
ncbi:YodC family protein [Arcobacter sp.]|uniref:YodC family protein n=1 Tax=unclassified Arcobacter TaxID=2593671 RepID=UPI003B00C502